MSEEQDRQRIVAELVRKYRAIFLSQFPPWQLEMMNATPDRLLADIVADSRRGVSPPSSLASRPQSPEDRPRTPSAVAVPVASPPGVALCDRLVDAQDRRDRADRIREAMETARIDRLTNERAVRIAEQAAQEQHFEKGPSIKSEYNPFDSDRIKNK